MDHTSFQYLHYDLNGQLPNRLILTWLLFYLSALILSLITSYLASQKSAWDIFRPRAFSQSVSSVLVLCHWFLIHS